MQAELDKARKREKLDLWDAVGLKRALDDAVIEVRHAQRGDGDRAPRPPPPSATLCPPQVLHEAGYELDHSMVDLKIVLGVVA